MATITAIRMVTAATLVIVTIVGDLIGVVEVGIMATMAVIIIMVGAITTVAVTVDIETESGLGVLKSYRAALKVWLNFLANLTHRNYERNLKFIKQ